MALRVQLRHNADFDGTYANNAQQQQQLSTAGSTIYSSPADSSSCPVSRRRSFLSSILLLWLGFQVDKEGNLKRAESTFRSTVSDADDSVHRPGAFVRSSSEFRNSVSPDDPTFQPGEDITSLSYFPRVRCSSDAKKRRRKKLSFDDIVP